MLRNKLVVCTILLRNSFKILNHINYATKSGELSKNKKQETVDFDIWDKDTEALLGGPPMKSKINKTNEKKNFKTAEKSKNSPNNIISVSEVIKELKPEQTSLPIKIDKYVMKPEQISVSKKVDNLLTKQQQIANIVKRQDNQEFIKISRRYKNYFEFCNFNTSFLDTNLIKKYPICSFESIHSYKNFYKDSDLSLMDTKLFEIKDEYKNEKKKLIPPSLSSILKLTESPQSRLNLQNWKVKKILELGEEEFGKYFFELKQRGEEFHKSIDDFTTSDKKFEEINVKKNHESAWKSLESIITKDITKTLYSECKVFHENLCYAGKFDSICIYKDKIYIVEWKLGEKRKDKLQDLYDYPLQLVSYLGALLVDSKYTDLRKKHEIKSVMVVHAYVNGSPPSIHCLDFHQVILYWTSYLGRLQKFWTTIRDFKAY